MDRLLRQEIGKEFRSCMEGLQERYVTAKTLSKHIETLTPEWLKRNGSCFDSIRTKVVWKDENGVVHDGGSYLYPLNKIMGMVEDGSIKDLQVTPSSVSDTDEEA